MKYFFDCWDRLKDGLKDKQLFLFLDYDGTLAPLRARPGEALLPDETRSILQELSHENNLLLAVISGRKIDDVKSKVGLEHIIYSGNHGLELSSPHVKFDGLATPGYLSILRRIKTDLEQRLAPFRNALIEDKDITLSVHYRTVDPRDIPAVKTLFHEATILYLIRNKIKVKEQRMDLEVWPPVNWDKGKIVNWLLARQELAGDRPVFPVYVGDDLTDEDAFRTLKCRGLTIFVCARPGNSAAEYYLKDQGEVAELLRRFLDMERGYQHV
ncbi:MAG: trehalose-phosphatase [Deltaproteobacteria bacterium]